jgi:transcriptional regulator with XRE-family HTH domain
MHDELSFGSRVRRRRKVLDLTQAALAQRVGCAVVTIQKIEANARRPAHQIAEQLADQLAIPLADRKTFCKVARVS